MKKILIGIIAIMALMVTACGSVKYSPEFQAIYDKYIAETEEMKTIGEGPDMMPVKVYYYASNFDTAYNAKDLTGVPDLFGNAIAFMVVHYKSGSVGYELGKGTWDALNDLYNGNYDDYHKKMDEQKKTFEAVENQSLEDYLATHDYSTIIQGIGAGR